MNTMEDNTFSGVAQNDLQDCVNACIESYRMCSELIPYCLDLGGKHANPDHIRLLMDSAQICQTSADFMIRGSPLHTMICSICAEVCDQCAEDCNRFDDSQMTACSVTCRECAAACRSMAHVLA